MSESSKDENVNKEDNESSLEKDPGALKDELTLEERLQISEEKLLRSLADSENQRRRFEKEIKDAFEFGSFNFAKESLAILDNLQRAKEAIINDEDLKKNQDLDKFLENINIIEKDLVSIFEKNRIKKIKAHNTKFDPNIHQAMLEVEDDSLEPGLIVQEIQPGYMFQERLLRPSFVAVSKKKTNKDKKQDNKGK